MYPETMEWTEEVTDIRIELGDTELIKRTKRLASYERYNTLVSVGGKYGEETLAFTPEQAIAFAQFAKTLGKDVLVVDNKIVKEKPLEELVHTVCQRELSARKYAEERKRKEEEAS